MNVASNIRLPQDLYRVSRVSVGPAFTLAERLNRNDWNAVRRLPYLAGSPERPIYNVRRDILRIDNGAAVDPNVTQIGVHWVSTPPTVRWGYVVVNEKALYDSGSTVDFRLHVSEQVDLVYKILRLAGVALEKDQVMRAGQGMEMAKVTQEKQ